eukprot:CFRG5885T1
MISSLNERTFSAGVSPGEHHDEHESQFYNDPMVSNVRFYEGKFRDSGTFNHTSCWSTVYPVVPDSRRTAEYIEQPTFLDSTKPCCYLAPAFVEYTLALWEQECNPMYKTELLKLITKLMKDFDVCESALLVCMVYLQRLKMRFDTCGFNAQQCSVQNSIVCMMVATKFLYDIPTVNSLWAEVSGIRSADINQMELELLRATNYSLNVSEQEVQLANEELRMCLRVSEYPFSTPSYSTSVSDDNNLGWWPSSSDSFYSPENSSRHNAQVVFHDQQAQDYSDGVLVADPNNYYSPTIYQTWSSGSNYTPFREPNNMHKQFVNHDNGDDCRDSVAGCLCPPGCLGVPSQHPFSTSSSCVPCSRSGSTKNRNLVVPQCFVPNLDYPSPQGTVDWSYSGTADTPTESFIR